MNIDNIKYAIEVLENVQANNKSSHYDALSFMQADMDGLGIVKTFDEFVQRNVLLDFIGLMGISDKFREDGGELTEYGTPIYKKLFGRMAIAAWLNIPPFTIEQLNGAKHFDIVYPDLHYLSDIKPKHVIAVLYKYMINGLLNHYQDEKPSIHKKDNSDNITIN